MSDYATLRADMGYWLNRSDLTAHIATFIRMAEARFNRTLRVMQMIASSQTTANNAKIPLPDDWLELRTLQLDGVPLGYVSPEEAGRLQRQYSSGARVFYTLLGSDIELVPTQGSGTLTIDYYARIPALSPDAPTNWLLDGHYDAYLYASLSHSAPFLADDERIPVWQGGADRALTELQAADERVRRSGATLIPRMRQGYG